MLSDDEKRKRLERVENFEAAVGSGSFWESQDVGGNLRGLPPAPSEEELRKTGLVAVAKSFGQNVERFNRYSCIPFNFFMYFCKYQQLLDKICLEESGGIGYPEDKITARRVDKKFSKAKNAWIGGTQDFTFRFPPVIQHSDVASVAAFSDDNDPAIRAFCESLVIQSYIVFEVVAEDLWVAAVNSRPDRLARLQGKLRSRFDKRQSGTTQGRKPAETRDSVSPKSDKISISIDDLSRHGFNLQGIMGSILNTPNRVSFRSLSDIRAAYHRAFDQQNRRIDDILDEEGIQYVAAVRNLLVHKASEVDQQFLDQTSQVSNVPKVNIGDVFPLTGQRTAELTAAAVGCAGRLISAVHTWLLSH